MKLTKSKLKQIIKEELKNVLKENENDENAVTYSITDYFEEEGINVHNAAEINLPSGKQISFAKILEDLVGQEITDETFGETFIVTLDNFREHENESLEDIALNMLARQQGPLYIDQWAKKNGFVGAERSGGW